ncbi:hypothetical protein [Streptomyces sp. NPDC015131]|uniref:hypothetical protein n=1 Tax=Streptomyces sp. NPDC015131 TaxID=3364941 RepID=UPI0036FE9585
MAPQKPTGADAGVPREPGTPNPHPPVPPVAPVTPVPLGDPSAHAAPAAPGSPPPTQDPHGTRATPGTPAPHDTSKPPVAPGTPDPRGTGAVPEPHAAPDPYAPHGTHHDPHTGHGNAPAPAGDHRAGRGGGVSGVSEPLVARELRDELGQRLQQALSGFVDSPQRSVKEAAAVLDDAADHLTSALDEHRRTLRSDWGEEDHSREPDTERLRVTLQAYRAMAERLLHV